MQARTRLNVNEIVMATSAIADASSHINAGQCSSGFFANLFTRVTVIVVHTPPPDHHWSVKRSTRQGLERLKRLENLLKATRARTMIRAAKSLD